MYGFRNEGCAGGSFKTILLAHLLTGILAFGAGNELADVIVQSANVDAGLCLHVGAGEGNLALHLAQRGRFLVYALEPERERAQRAQKLIRTQGSYGQARVEHRPIDPLPLAENLVNLLVVDDLHSYPSPPPSRSATFRF